MEFEQFIKTLSHLELVILRHDVKTSDDNEALKTIDAEIKSRVKNPSGSIGEINETRVR